MFIQFPMAKTSKQECMKTLAKMGKDLLHVILEYLYKKCWKIGPQYWGNIIKYKLQMLTKEQSWYFLMKRVLLYCETF